ncbi:D-2-hydroxyacid dehydrogenase [Natranaerobius trueperi]|uniref:D-2-hydroxyacid dehydrogenase n=1 Tax=Natranaerobius trueperi TaxID=759412 RepID=A0A226C385_9FIRM|nr:D-2-hydroxyacid dehydrogenase [Natranaerobius trueperi]OWZ84919.1 D-2-hydroxyacid dehydrogenase [Natranaerobius trueperi]
MKILYTGNLKEDHRHDLLSDFPQVDLVSTANESIMDIEICDSDIFISWGRFITPERIARGKNLKWVHALSTGVDKFLIPEIISSDMLLSNSRGIHKEQISEHVFSFLLPYVRRQFDYRKMQKRKEWEHLTISGLANKTIGIVGLGSIGEEIAKKAKVFDMTVVATKKNPTNSIFVDKMYSSKELNKILPMVDFLVLIVPLTDETQNLIGEKELSLMKKSAFLVNMARGGVVDEKALYKALIDNEIAGAGLDVFSKEPLPQDSPLWELDNCYITPHVGGVSPDYTKKAMALFKENLQAYISGKELPTKVDKHKGY